MAFVRATFVPRGIAEWFAGCFFSSTQRGIKTDGFQNGKMASVLSQEEENPPEKIHPNIKVHLNKFF